MAFSFEPYEGKQPYIFISYCREDTRLCETLLDILGKKGARVWYDNAIHVGTVWPDIIANHLKACSICILLITDGFVSSVNCNRELAFSSKNNIPIIPIIVDGTNVTSGIDLMIGATQYIKLKKNGSGETDTSALDKVFGFPQIGNCLGEPPKDPPKEPSKDIPKDPPKDIPKDPPKDIPKDPPKDIPKDPPKDIPKNTSNYSPEKQAKYVLFNESRCEAFSVASPKLSISRDNKGIRMSGKREEDGEISIINREDGALVIKAHSDTDLSVGLLKKNEEYKISDGMIKVRIGEQTASLIVGSAVGALIDIGYIHTLRCDEADEIKIITEGSFIVGREFAWPKGSLDDELISDRHALIKTEKDTAYICDIKARESKPSNGVIVNREIIDGDEMRALKDGDIIQLGRTLLRYGKCRIKEAEKV